jgi:AcrR family transcriptional regulator
LKAGTREARDVRKSGVRQLAAQATRKKLLRSAIKVFSRHGLSGGSVDMISKAAKSHDRMIYYYFGSKENLFIAVLEEMYRRFNEAEASLKLDMESPVESLMTVVDFIVSYYRDNPEFITLLNSENLHRGKHISKSLRASGYSAFTLSVLDQLVRRGADKGLFRDNLRTQDLYLMIASMGYFYQSNRYTLSAFFGEKLTDSNSFEHWKAFVKSAVLKTVATLAQAGRST